MLTLIITFTLYIILEGGIRSGVKQMFKSLKIELFD